MTTFKFLIGITVLAVSASAGDIFPLQTGNTWAYRNAASGELITMDVGSPAVIGERVYFQLRGYVQGSVLVRVNENNELVRIDEETGREQVLTVLTPQRSAWEAPARGCRQEGLTREQPGVHEGAAGPFHNVLEVEYRVISCADAGVELEQFAANIGMVRRVLGSIKGPETFDLAYARIGNLEINATPNATFSVSTLHNLPPGDITALLRLRTNSTYAIPLEFPTGQEFDVALVDPEGKVVWKWSDGQVFTNAVHRQVIAGHWAVPVRLPRPPAGGYTLRAWLTTASTSPQFAAAVPLVLAR